MDAEALMPWVEMALDAVGREYPYAVVHVATDDRDIAPPRVLHPAFHGAFDWHSSVHGHWCLARAARLHPRAPFAVPARAALDRALTAAAIAGEVATFTAPGRAGFERPYGLAWLLQLAAELRAWADADARRWHAALTPLESLARERLAAWLPTLPGPVRGGEHPQSAFALGLAHDWCASAGDAGFSALLERRAIDFFAADRAAPVAYEPSAHDFLSPVLAEADLLRRVMPGPAFATWIEGFLPAAEDPALARWLVPVQSPDRSDGKLAHLDGLNLSRAWMLEGVAAALPPGHGLCAPLADAAARHREAGLGAARTGHYAGTHWLGSFAVYLLTGRGLDPD